MKWACAAAAARAWRAVVLNLRGCNGLDVSSPRGCAWRRARAGARATGLLARPHSPPQCDARLNPSLPAFALCSRYPHLSPIPTLRHTSTYPTPLSPQTLPPPIPLAPS